MKKSVIILCLFAVFLSCKETDLEYALRLAGENRTELEKVLEHYSQNPADSLKLKAAVFLIENMPGHYSYADTGHLKGYYKEVKEAVLPQRSNGENTENLLRLSRKYRDESVREYVPDLQMISSGYLINNIEQAFDLWQNGEWATHLDFSEFCEYILPYKVDELQDLDNWREYSKELFKTDLQYLHHCDIYKNSAYWACTFVNREIEKKHTQKLPADATPVPVRNLGVMANMPFGSCSDYCFLKTAIMRGKGIPVAEDFTPHWPFMSAGHSWNVVLINNGRNEMFSGGEHPGEASDPGMIHKPDEKKAKVFRKVYAINKEIQALLQSEKEVPRLFENYHIKDVSEEYMGDPADVELTISGEFKNLFKYAYLAVFNDRQWAPVHFGKVSGDKVVFTKMGKDIMYLPVYCKAGKVIPFDAPFLLTSSGRIEPCKIDTADLQTIEARRKYFVGKHCYGVADRFLGGEFHAANKADFSDSIIVNRFDDYVAKAGEFEVNTNAKYRYWRYYSAKGKYNNMGEIYFFPKGSIRPAYGKIIGSEGTCGNPEINTKNAVFDKDPLTYYDAKNPFNDWAGMDFSEPVEMDRIAYVPRGDGNDVYPDNKYELAYWKNDRWVSLGAVVSNDVKIIYKQVPSNTLYWLKNLTTGKDERIFTYKNGEQIWW